MAVFRMDSDNYFVQNNLGDTGVRVYKYEEYMNIFGMIKANCPRFTQLADNVTSLEILGVTISKEGLATLARDLTINAKDGKKLHFVANRQGVCFVNVDQNEPIKWMRINGLFCWSKYGVVVKPGESNDAVLSRSSLVFKA